jgi:hypothetical protein
MADVMEDVEMLEGSQMKATEVDLEDSDGVTSDLPPLWATELAIKGSGP